MGRTITPLLFRSENPIFSYVLMKLMDGQIAELDRALEQAAEADPQARLLMTQPGVGPVTALAFVLTLGDVSRFPRGKQVAGCPLESCPRVPLVDPGQTETLNERSRIQQTGAKDGPAGLGKR